MAAAPRADAQESAWRQGGPVPDEPPIVAREAFLAWARRLLAARMGANPPSQRSE